MKKAKAVAGRFVAVRHVWIGASLQRSTAACLGIVLLVRGVPLVSVLAMLWLSGLFSILLFVVITLSLFVFAVSTMISAREPRTRATGLRPTIDGTFMCSL